MKTIFQKIAILRNPKKIYGLSDEQIDSWVIEVALDKKLDILMDVNDVLKTNYDFVKAYIEKSNIEFLESNLWLLPLETFKNEEIEVLMNLLYQKSKDLFLIRLSTSLVDKIDMHGLMFNGWRTYL